MAVAALQTELAYRLRAFPRLHRSVKGVQRFVTERIPDLSLDLWRVIAPAGNLRLGPPTGSFSVYNTVRAEGPRPGRVVVTDQGVPPCTSESLQVIAGLGQHNTQPWPVFWSHHKNAHLVSSSLGLLNDQKQICRESSYGDRCVKHDPSWKYFSLPEPVRLSGNWTSVVSRWVPSGGIPTFSHWILDALPRLALLSEFPSDTQILVPCRLAAYQKETLSLLGLLDRCRFTPERHLLVENYYFSSPTAMISCYSPYGVNYLRSAFLPLADKSYRGPKRFIIARRSGLPRGIQNQDELYDYFRKLGWEIVDTEKLTFAQEIQLFANAEAYAGILGSGFTNALWSPPGCKVITFVASNWVDGWAEWICQVNQLDYHWKIFPANQRMMAQVDLGEVTKLLRKAGLEN
jgi:hypothetical protein